MFNMKQQCCLAVILFGSALAQVNADKLLKAVTRTKDMIITSSSDATKAGEAVLRSGGTAVDAMIAAQAVMGLVRPQDSGIGGGAFAIYYDADTAQIKTFDGRETSPAAATEDRFQGMNFVKAWQSGLSVGVPGVPRLLEVMHDKYGKKEWSRLFESAIDLAENGFKFHPTVSMYIEMMYGMFGFSCVGEDVLFFRDPTAKNYFVSEDCTAPPPDKIMYNQEYANTLRSIARDGAKAFYTGDIAYNIVDAVVNDLNIVGDMTLEDLETYTVIERSPVCASFRGHDVCGMGPPSSGGIAVGQILGILDKLNQDAQKNPLDPKNIHVFTQAMRLAFADRNQYVADSDFVEVPVEGMMNDEYLAARSNLIDDTDMGFVSPGNPSNSTSRHSSFLVDQENGTAHISIIDQYGNALSMTTTIESSFGNSVMVNGFLLNNELTDFSFDARDKTNNQTIANKVEAKKRPRSSMSPTIVLKDGKLEIVTGSAGGSKIIGDTAQTIVSMIDFGLDPQESANHPHYQNRNDKTEIESPQSGLFGNGLIEYDAEQAAAKLEAMGHDATIVPMWLSKLTTIQVLKDASVGTGVYVGGVDPRSDGSIGSSKKGGQRDIEDSILITLSSEDDSDASNAASMNSSKWIQHLLVSLCLVLCAPLFQ